MTCIVARPGLMVADSRETGLIKSTCAKLYRRHGYAVGGSGESAPLTTLEHVIAWPRTPSVEAFARWMHRHSGDVAFADCELLVANRSRVWHLAGGAVSELRGFAAIGSGAAFALGYLEAHATDLDGAVAAACKYDPFCAGPIRRLSLDRK